MLSYTLDKNDEPVYTVRAVNGEQTGAEFKLKMKIPDGVVIEGRNYRDKANADSLVGQHIEYAWESLSDSKVPGNLWGYLFVIWLAAKVGSNKFEKSNKGVGMKGLEIRRSMVVGIRYSIKERSVNWLAVVSRRVYRTPDEKLVLKLETQRKVNTFSNLTMSTETTHD